MTSMNNRVNSAIGSVGAHASVAEFSDVLLFNMDRFYLLAYLLTGNQERAERSFIAGIDDCVNGISVFSEWAQSRIRRAIIKNAVRILSTESDAENDSFNSGHHDSSCLLQRDDLLRAVLQLKPFERCVFVISVLEQFSELDCSLLLSSTHEEVAKARRMAVENLVSARIRRKSRQRAGVSMAVCGDALLTGG